MLYKYIFTIQLPNDFGRFESGQTLLHHREGRKEKRNQILPLIMHGFCMKNRTPEGLTSGQWDAVIAGLENRPSTINDYRKVLNLLHSYSDGEYHISTLSKEQAAAYFSYLDQRGAEGTLSENTIHRYKATLRSIGTRIENKPALWPGYANPFSGLVTNENRKRTEYRKDMFADASVIAAIRAVMPELSKEEQLILMFMMYFGFTPAQIQNLKISDFFTAAVPERKIGVHIKNGTFLEFTSNSWKESHYYLENYPVRYVRKSPNRSITWEYTGTILFTKSFEEQLHSFYEFTGISTDTRAFFLTARHLEFNYRAMHHMILNVCKAAGVDPKQITPNMISRYGMIHSYLLGRCCQEIETLSAAENRTPEQEQSLAFYTERLKKLREIGEIGAWAERYPVPLQERIDSIIRYLGEDFLWQAVGI